MSTPHLKPLRSPWAVGLANQFNLQTLPRHADQILVAAAVYQSLFSVVSPAISRLLVPDVYGKFDERTRTGWNVRVVAFVQACFICVKALSVVFNDPSRRNTSAQRRLWEYSSQAGAVQAYAAGYFLWDIYVSIRYMHVSGPSALVHAICAFLVTMVGFVSSSISYGLENFANCLQRPFGNYYGVNFVLYELSTPFLNIHWMLDKFGMTGSNLQLYNGLALMASFFGCRLVWGSYQTWLMTTDMLSAWRAGPVPRILFPTYLFANTTLTCLNFYWFSKMVQALRKRFQPKDKQN